MPPSSSNNRPGNNAFGPVVPLHEGVVVRSPHPPGAGFGGVGYGPGSPSGSGRSMGRGLPTVASAVSLNGFEIEVHFSEEMDPEDPALLELSSYSLTPLVGAAPSSVTLVTVESLAGSGPNVASVIVRHTGTTLGGSYRVTVTGPKDASGTALTGQYADLYTRGEPPAFVAVPTAGNKVLLSFAQDMLEQDLGDEVVSAIKAPDSYSFVSVPDYPVELTITDVTHPFEGDLSKIEATVKGMTSLEYTLTLGSATAIAYTGSVLPSLFSGGGTQNQGITGTASIVSSRLSLSTTKGNGSYLVSFADVTDKLVSGCSFRADVVFNATGSFIPALQYLNNTLDTMVSFVLVDSPMGEGEGIRVNLSWDTDTQEPVVSVLSGETSFISRTDLNWTEGQHTVSFVRNPLAGISSVLFDETPIYSIPAGDLEPSTEEAAGVYIYLTSGNEVKYSGLKVHSVSVTASSTVYSAAWNFFHNQQAVFDGSDEKTRGFFMTQRGPLVKAWGDATPASVQDVKVYVQGEEVEVSAVNPYTGRIDLSVPIPLLPADESDVSVDYNWLTSPAMPLVGLNTEGLVLNKYDMARGRHSETTRIGLGALDGQRFPMGVVLGPAPRTKPLYIGHRYMGFEKDYSALLNSDTLMLNQSPHRTAVPDFERTPTGVVVAFEGDRDPIDWTPVGEDLGSADADTGVYTLTSATSTALYLRDEDLSFPSSVYVVGRMKVASTTPHGVFTGVGFGVHDTQRLYAVGCLLVNGVRHVGFLLDPEHSYDVDAWEIGPKVEMTVHTATTVKGITAHLPIGLVEGSRFQVLTGNQAGVYTITHLVEQTDGTSTITVSPSFPANWRLYGNKVVDAYFEVLYDERWATYRLDVDLLSQVAQFSVSGELTSAAVYLDGSKVSVPLPAETTFLPPFGQKGQLFFGALDEEASSSTQWSFFRYGVVPNVTTVRGHAINVFTEMNVLPERNPQHFWSLHGNFGSTQIDPTGDTLFLQALGGQGSSALLYRREEPFLRPDSITDVFAKFRGELAPNPLDMALILQDGKHKVALSGLMFAEVEGTRSLITLPVVSFNGRMLPEDQGWETGLSSTPDLENWALVQTDPDTWTQGLVGEPTWEALDTGDRVLAACFAVTTHTTNSDDDTNIRLLCDTGVAARLVGLTLRAGSSPGVRLFTEENEVVGEYDFDWTDGENHLYRIIVDATGGTVTLFVDDVLQLPTLSLASFTGGSLVDTAVFGLVRTDMAGDEDTSLTATVSWQWVGYGALPGEDVQYTIGVYLGGDEREITNWEIPRTDALSVPNSDTSAAVEEMDWRENVEVRLRLDPEWGLTVFRPDLPLPPYYAPENGSSGTGFATQVTEPSAGWINVETKYIPKEETFFGSVAFGAYTSGSFSQQRWEWVRYRIAKSVEEDLRAPQHMVLNQANVITSGERLLDKGHEVVIIQTLDTTRLTLKPTHLYAQSIYKVVDGTSIFTPDMWSFDPLSQTLTLIPDDEGEVREFSSPHANVTVVFIHGKPVTDTYLLSQPVLDSVTLLNEGTPPFPKHQVVGAEKHVINGGQLNWPLDTLNTDEDFVLNDPLRTEVLRDDANALYENMHFYEVDDGGQTGLISFPCESTIGNAVEVSGSSLTEIKAGGPKKDAFNQKGGAPGAFFYASGGSYVGSRVNGEGKIVSRRNPLGGQLNASVIYPTSNKTPKRLVSRMRFSSVLTDGDDVPLLEEMSPPLEVSATAVMMGPGNYSRLGPWGGRDALAARRDSGFIEVQGVLSPGVTLTVEAPEGILVTLTGASVVVSDTQFAVSPSPHVNLAAAINAHPDFVGVVRASYGTNLSGLNYVKVESLTPVLPEAPVTITVSGSNLRVYGTVGGVLTGGAKMTQGSHLAGGDATLDENGVHDPSLGMVAQGGGPLPKGVRYSYLLTAPP